MPLQRHVSGGLAAASAFLMWGLLPTYWKALHMVPALEILSHRIVWSFFTTLIMLAVMGRLAEFTAIFRCRRSLLLLCGSTFLVSTNWGTYIWAVNHGFVLQTSLGYYITPLINALLGFVVLRERLSRLQGLAVALAFIGVMIMIIGYGHFPFIALVLAFSFGAYGLVRKVVEVQSLPGLCTETMFAALPAAAFLIWLALHGQGDMGRAPLLETILLFGSGPITTIPLLLFAFAARRVMLTTIGLFQFIAPTCFFLLGVFVYHEPFTTTHLITFAFIWTAVLLYATHGILVNRQARRVKDASGVRTA